MKELIGTFLAAIIVANSITGGYYKSHTIKQNNNRNAAPITAFQDNRLLPESSLVSQFNDELPPEPLQCNTSSEKAFYLGPCNSRKNNPTNK